MRSLRSYLLLLVSIWLLAGCKQKKKPLLSGEEPVEVNDFIDFFPEKNLPYEFADSSLLQKSPDSLRISYKVFSEFVPDSVLNRIFGKGMKPKFYPMAKITVPKAETYLFVKALSGGKSTGLLAAFDKKKSFIALTTIMQPDQNFATQQTAGMDKKFSIFKTTRKKNSDGSVNEGKDVYILNSSAKDFMLILTNPLDAKPPVLINPIDTLPRKHKLSADYTAGKNDLVSIRDGSKPNRIMFFIHFEKNNGECTGELKGEAVLRSPAVADYHSNSNPCSLQLTFTPTTVSIKELQGCGSYRGVHCVFDGKYIRKKETVKKKK
ncbi:MAG: hypothetical protein LC128_06480 [Chitinophagales bacterium]|nr:hypothetical protein [Chitinophagales bacterium]